MTNGSLVHQKLVEVEREFPWGEFSRKFRKYLFEISRAIGPSLLDSVFECRHSLGGLSDWQLLLEVKKKAGQEEDLGPM